MSPLHGLCVWVHSSKESQPAGLGCTPILASIPITAFLPFTVRPLRRSQTWCQKRKWKTKLNLGGPFSACSMSHYYISAWHFMASREGGPVLKAEQMRGTQACLCLTVPLDLWIKGGGFVSVVSLVPCKNNNLSLFDILTYSEKWPILTLQVLVLKSGVRTNKSKKSHVMR